MLCFQKGSAKIKSAVSGIPVRRAFYGIGKEEVSEKEGKKEVLIMGGGLGLIPSSERFLHRLSARSDIRVTVITGKNEKLRRELSREVSEAEYYRIHRTCGQIYAAGGSSGDKGGGNYHI